MSDIDKDRAGLPGASADHRSLEEAILQTVRGIRYGSIEITVHNAKVVQIERREKLRFAENNHQ